MAGEWIKVGIDTADKPEVLRMARSLKLDRDTILGKLLRVWGWFNRNSVDGTVDGAVDTDVDDLAGCVGFASAMRGVGWLASAEEGEGLLLPNFERHNGETAKTRALKAERQARWRQKRPTPASTTPSTPTSTGASTREEKRRIRGEGDPSLKSAEGSEQVLKAIEATCCLDLSMASSSMVVQLSDLVGRLQEKHRDWSASKLADEILGYGSWYGVEIWPGHYPTLGKFAEYWPKYLSSKSNGAIDPHYGEIKYHRAGDPL